jgi:hypothetical protein
MTFNTTRNDTDSDRTNDRTNPCKTPNHNVVACTLPTSCSHIAASNTLALTGYEQKLVRGNRAGQKGGRTFARYPSIPAEMQRSRSPETALAVRAMILTFLLQGEESCRILRVASYPSSPGIWPSMRLHTQRQSRSLVIGGRMGRT